MHTPQGAPSEFEKINFSYEDASPFAWCRSGGQIPDGMNIVRGGTDNEGRALHIARAKYKGGIHPGMCILGKDEVTITWGGDAITVNDYELLCARDLSVQWIKVNGTFLLRKTYGFVPILGGQESDDRLLYIIQGYYEGGVYCGKVREKSIGYIPHNENEVLLNQYHVLVQYKGPHRIQSTHFRTLNEKSLELSPGNKFSRWIPILTKSSSPPIVACWLNHIDLSESLEWWRVSAYVDRIELTRILANTNTWNTNVLYSAGLSSMLIESTNPDFRCGVVDCDSARIQRVSFDWHYEEPPTVFVAIRALDIGKAPRISIQAVNIGCTGFDLEVKTWRDTIIYNISTTWVAFPTNSKSIQVGSFEADRTCSVGSVAFSPTFGRSPKILTGFNFLDVNPKNIRLDIVTANVSHESMDWKILSWWDSEIYRVGVNYIAFV